jgi:hypothetical protein
VDDDHQEVLERAQAVLLAARFLFYQSLAEQAKSMADRFNDFWEKLGWLLTLYCKLVKK